MNDLFEVKLQHIDHVGKKVKDTYIVEAFNYTDTEATITELVNSYSMSSPEIKGIKPFKCIGIVNDPEGDLWYKVKMETSFITEDGKESKCKSLLLVEASNMSSAMTNVKNYMKDSMSNWRSVVIQETDITDVILKPLS